jgi:adenosylcobinamide-GDP ribazoletransferase
MAAVRFLTILPFRRGAEFDGMHFQNGLYYFPVVGMIIGGLALTAVSVAGRVLPQSLTGFLGIVALAAVSGCLHLDGLADSADGLLSSRPRENKLSIMRDSRIGAMGVIAIVFVVLGKFAALSSSTPAAFGITIVLMPLAGRSAIVASMALLPYARPEGGLGTLFYSPHIKKAALLSTGIWLIAVVLAGRMAGLAPGGIVAAIVIPAATVLLFSAWCRSSLGGATGDTLGAVCELSELMTAVAVLCGQ